MPRDLVMPRGLVMPRDLTIHRNLTDIRGKFIDRTHTLFEQCLALTDSEPVLLVAEDKPETAESDAVRNQRVRANYKLYRAVRQPAVDLASLGGRGRAGQ